MLIYKKLKKFLIVVLTISISKINLTNESFNLIWYSDSNNPLALVLLESVFVFLFLDIFFYYLNKKSSYIAIKLVLFGLFFGFFLNILRIYFLNVRGLTLYDPNSIIYILGAAIFWTFFSLIIVIFRDRFIKFWK